MTTALVILLLLALALGGCLVLCYVVLSLDRKSTRLPVAKTPPELCQHKEWTPDYVYSRGPNGEAQCRVVDSYCVECGTKQRGSGQ